MYVVATCAKRFLYTLDDDCPFNKPFMVLYYKIRHSNQVNQHFSNFIMKN